MRSITSDAARPDGLGRMPRAQRQAQLLTAAASAFVHGGFDGTSMEDVAEAAGVTRLIVYRNFGSKEELYRAVLASVTERLADEFSDGASSTDVHPGGIPGVLLRVARERPDSFRLLWRHAVHEPLFAEQAHAFRDVAATVADVLIHPYVHDRALRRWAATTVVSHLYDATCNWLDLGDPALDEEFAHRMSAGLRALVGAWTAPRARD
jgi:AcrR family transcriptional regulator